MHSSYIIFIALINILTFRGAKKKPYLTAEQFRDFLNSEQRDPRLNEILYPYTDTAKAQALIHQFEPNHSLAHKGTTEK